MKTILIRPSLCKENTVPYTPMNIFVLGSYINEVADVIIWDFPIKYGIPLTKEKYLHVFEKFKDDILSEEPQVVGVSCTSGDEYIPTLRVARAVKEVLPSATVVVGGYHGSSCAEEMLRQSKDIDCMVTGEGEETLKRIVQNKQAKKSVLQDVPGILTFKNNTMFRTDPVYVDLNNLPFLSLDFMESARIYPNSAMELSRGCPFKCNFCQEPVIRGRMLRLKNPKRAVDELEYLRENLGNDNFFFHDVLFGANEKWTIKVCEDMSQRSLDIKWCAMVRVDLRKETLQKMSKAGARSLFYGLESGSQEVLRLIDKIPGTKDYTGYLRKAEQTFIESVRVGIVPIIGTIVGYPGENMKTMQETTDYLERVVKKCKKVSDVGIWFDPRFYLPLPETRAFELLGSYEKEFGTKVIGNTEWWKEDFPFVNYFKTVAVVPSRQISLKALQRHKKLVEGMSYLARKSYGSSYWMYVQTSRIRMLRRKMMKGDIFPTKDFLQIASEEWKKRQIQPYKVSFTEMIIEKIEEFSRLLHRGRTY